MTNSYIKGRAFEQQIVKKLTQNTGVEWRRVPNSGGLASSTSNLWRGDVFSEHKKFVDIIIECKAINRIELTEVFRNKSNLWKWIKHAEDKYTNWVLIIKRDHGGIYALSPYPDVLDRIGVKWENEFVICKLNLRYVLCKF